MKRILSIILMFLLIINMVPIVGVAADVYEPAITIENAQIPLVNPGSETSITLYIKNSGGGAQNVTMTPIFDGEGPFKANGLTSSISVPNISSSRTAVKLDLSVLPEAKGGTYPIKLKFDYKYIKSYNETSTEWGYGTQELIIYVKVNDQTTQPRLIITEITTDPQIIVPGQKFKLNVFFENKGSLEAKDIKTKLSGLTNVNGFTISGGSDIQYIKSVRGKSISFVTYELKAANSIKKGSHELNLNFNYASIDEPQKIYINVGGSGNQSSSLIMENIIYPTDSIGHNKEVEVSFDLRNQGQMESRNIIVKAESVDQTGLVAKSVSTIKLNSIEAGATETLNFKFLTTMSGETKNYPINVTVEYVDDLSPDAEMYSLNQFIGIFVIAPKEPGPPTDPIKSTPRLIIDRYDFIPALVQAGENFSMNLSFFNTNSTKTVKNIKIFLTSDEKTDPNSNSGGGSVFTPVDSSNTFYIDSIAPKGRVEKTITMFTVPDAQAKTYTLTANFEYEDNKGEAYTATELIGVPVIQQSRLETGELNVSPEAYIGQPAPISLEFYNTGKVTLYNMMVKLEGDFQTESGSLYIGNFVSGGSEYFEGMIIPSEPGELTGDVVFTYEDSTGQEQEIRKPFTLNVMDSPPMPEFPGEELPPMDEGGGKLSKLIKSPWLWGTLIIIGGISGFVIYKKKKKQKELALDE